MSVVMVTAILAVNLRVIASFEIVDFSKGTSVFTTETTSELVINPSVVVMVRVGVEGVNKVVVVVVVGLIFEVLLEGVSGGVLVLMMEDVGELVSGLVIDDAVGGERERERERIL